MVANMLSRARFEDDIVESDNEEVPEDYFISKHVVVKKTVHKRNWSTKAWEPVLHTRARQEAYKDEVGTYEDRSGWIRLVKN